MDDKETNAKSAQIINVTGEERFTAADFVCAGAEPGLDPLLDLLGGGLLYWVLTISAAL